MGKIFGLGLSRTGTRSLQQALQRLGYRTAHWDEHLREARGVTTWFRGDFETDAIAGYDAAVDLPIAPYYAELDRRYPGSRFILTVRDVQSWLRSVERHWATIPMGDDAASRYRVMVRMAAYGTYGYSELRMRSAYEAHVRNVEWHFRGRPGDLLVLDIAAGEGWEKLCPFLGKPVPRMEFPWSNRAPDAAALR